MNLERPKTFLKQALLGLSLLGLAAQASAQTVVEDAWVRATVPGQASTGAFLTLTASADSKLLEAQSPVAKLVQIHQSSMKDDVMSMHEVTSVALPAGQPVVLDPSSYHIMLINLTAQVKEGDKVPLTLIVEDGKGVKQSIAVEATARALNAPDHGAMHDHSKMH
ncbi:copper chaperone PCu(A)C [Pseudomonas syringae]|uniref:copper chaperone PCu(A)C n=1 Tax=Pseudomonas quasicaspiana TaxID=2829821 RepID=UPI000F0467B1|nr:copper chaperone PCu(A)C [Pseudomonas quasicaspiana]MCD5974603.1 copper chaperone PCu(A)C [Pseudomonas quasicaspiana]MCQ2994611.1 copper chaperone PCu(A)C [Pseudomonas syringae]MCQ3003180.1 copper chaperone PCu(A)C [Pseudomonas syringae]MCQ3031697.1 copper chaperone PCu(A)C [Pseudomonas syringae]